MTAKHTPGPWILSKGEIITEDPIWSGAIVCTHPFCDFNHTPHDAALICAAPELLVALGAYVESDAFHSDSCALVLQHPNATCDCWAKETWNAAMAATKKARGE